MNILLVILLVLLLVSFFAGWLVFNPYWLVLLLVGIAATIYISKNA